MNQTRKVKPICFYLPQFHPIPENDAWWGQGFTEWTLVDGAKPLFDSHQHPRQPHPDVGRYHLLDVDVRKRQGDMARENGIHGFCYYHYWFQGKQLLEQPLDKMLEDGYPDIDFCLCWANEPWSRRWSGEDLDVLQTQDYGDEEDWHQHFQRLCELFDHPRYIRIDDQPMLLIYRIGHIPQLDRMIARWRELAVEKGYAGLHIIAIEGGFPDSQHAPDCVDGLASHSPSFVLPDCRPLVVKDVNVASVEEVWSLGIDRQPKHAVHYPGTCHAWDNTPRRGKAGYVVLPSRKQRFGRHLKQLFANVLERKHEPFVFLNAWNEWSEGASLEPDQDFGYDWLDAIRDAVEHPFVDDQIGSRSLDQQGNRPVATRFLTRSCPEPDVDLINVIVQQNVKAGTVLDIGCASGMSSEHICHFVGADRYIGLEPNRDWATNARRHLDEVYCVDVDSMDWSGLDTEPIDLIVCNELIGRVADPLSTLQGIRQLADKQTSLCIGFDHAGYHSEIRRLITHPPVPKEQHLGDQLGRKFTINQITKLITAAGFRIDKSYKIYSAGAGKIENLKSAGNRVKIGDFTITNLDREQVERLFLQRCFLFLSLDPSHQPVRNRKKQVLVKQPWMTGSLLEVAAHAGQDEATSLVRHRGKVNMNIAPKDRLFYAYCQSGPAEEYFRSAFKQLDLVDLLLQRYCNTAITRVESVCDYACHYGRLLRAMRTVLPESRLFAYDIDDEATRFCESEFNCIPCNVDWQADPSDSVEQHDLITCASLLTHTDYDFYCRLFGYWQRLLANNGLLCFTYLGSGYLDRWQRGELEHYGVIDPDIRRSKSAEFEHSGHAFAGFESPYSDRDSYGVGFISEENIRKQIEKYPALEYIGTIPGDQCSFNQDLAVVRKI